jgi:Rod binding domain-containing protein
VNYSIEPTQFMASALQAGDPTFSLSGLGKGFSVNPPSNLNNLENYLPAASSGMSLSSAHPMNPLTGTPTYSPAELKKVSQNFESIFMRMMFKEMRDSVQKSDLFGDSRTMGFFQSMSDDQLSDTLSAAGGIGLGKMIYQQLQQVTGPHQKTT